MPDAAGFPADPAPGDPLIVCGMHRSGLTLLASMLVEAGVPLAVPVCRDAATDGHLQTDGPGFAELHRRIFLANGLVAEGYTTQTVIPVPEPLQREAARLVEANSRQSRAWGWVDPRTTLVLDFWSRLVPNARYLFLVRRPWEVVDSLLRRGEPTIRYNPASAIDIWIRYNEAILAFARRHPATTVVCETSQLITDPSRIFSTLRWRFRLPRAAPSVAYDADRFHADDAPDRPSLIAAIWPNAYELYRELRDLAGSTAPLPDLRPVQGDVAGIRDILLAEWTRTTHRTLHEAPPASPLAWPRWWPWRRRASAA